MGVIPLRRLRSSRSDSLRTWFGKELVEVHYLLPEGVLWPDGYAVGEIDEVEEGVSLRFLDRTSVLVTWAMEQADEGLAVLDGSNDLTARYETCQVAQVTQWSVLLGKRLVGTETLWHRADESAAETALGVVLRFEGDSAVSIALGEVTDDGLSYRPDALVVLHSRAAVARYVDQLPTARAGVWEAVSYRAPDDPSPS
jgi:hypothetical protein